MGLVTSATPEQRAKRGNEMRLEGESFEARDLEPWLGDGDIQWLEKLGVSVEPVEINVIES